MSAAADRIERSILIAAPRARVWRLLADAPTFGGWFGADLRDQQFAVGARARGPITVAGYEHIVFDVLVERIEPEALLAWRWHPYAVDPKVDYEREARTLVTITLQDAPDGATRVTVVESGFDGVPPERRFEAFRMNTEGWEAQLGNLQRHATA
jgi:uncharacterized protein YndB with AHSA1/START domain